MTAQSDVAEPLEPALARLLRYQWSRRTRRPTARLRAASAIVARVRAARRRELVASALRICGLLGAASLLRVEVDQDGDVVLRDLNGVPVALVRAERGSLVRLF